MENWREIEGYEGKYLVSDRGNIFSVLRNRPLKTQENCVFHTVQVALFGGGKMKLHYVHRLVATAFLPNPNGCVMVQHIDGNKTNNCVNNLRWACKKGKHHGKDSK